MQQTNCCNKEPPRDMNLSQDGTDTDRKQLERQD